MKKTVLSIFAAVAISFGATAQPYTEDFSSAINVNNYIFQYVDDDDTDANYGLYLYATCEEGKYIATQEGGKLKINTAGNWEWDQVIIELPGSVAMAAGDKVIINAQTATGDPTCYFTVAAGFKPDNLVLATYTEAAQNPIQEFAASSGMGNTSAVTATAKDVEATVAAAQTVNVLILWFNAGWVTGCAANWESNWDQVCQAFAGTLEINSIVIEGTFTADNSSVQYVDLAGAKISQNFPNPFNANSTISYSLEKEANVAVKVFDLVGKEVASIVNATQQAGSYNVELNAKNFTQGVYYYSVIVNGTTASTKKMVVQ